MIAVGGIVGNGYVKGVCGERRTVFPSIAALATEVDFETTLGARRSVVSLENGGEWIVGEDALIFGQGRTVSLLDRARYGSPSFVALFRKLLLDVLPPDYRGPLRVFTGMPADWFRNTETKAALIAAVQQAALPFGAASVTVTPEAAGVYYAHVLADPSRAETRKEGDVGIIDLGYRDVNVAHFRDGRHVRTESIPGGAWQALTEIKRLIAKQYGLELTLHEVDAAVRRGSLMRDGHRVPLPEETDNKLLSGIPAIEATARNQWPNGGRSLQSIILGGGQAPVLFGALQTMFPQLSMVAEPQLAGARGFALVAGQAVLVGK